VDETVFTCTAAENLVQQERPLSSAPSVKKTAQSSGARHDVASFDNNAQKPQPKLTNVVADISSTSRNNIQEFSFWQEKNSQ
jgi:hypothetical protein